MLPKLITNENLFTLRRLRNNSGKRELLLIRMLMDVATMRKAHEVRMGWCDISFSRLL
jgi:hypothetical protein